jgi:hypothetical protein
MRLFFSPPPPPLPLVRFFVVACGLAVVVPLPACVLEAPLAVVGVLDVDCVGLFLLDLDSRCVTALLTWAHE